jgi:hypothetical protein
MNDQQYKQHCRDVFEQFNKFLQLQGQACSPDDPILELCAEFASASAAQNLHEDGPPLVAKLFGSCPHLSPAFPRELLWYLGGDCLHNMPDEEIALYQQLDELREQASARGEQLNLPEARAKLLKLQ